MYNNYEILWDLHFAFSNIVGGIVTLGMGKDDSRT